MVRILFGHGEGGNKRPDMPLVTRGNVLALLRIIRDFEPVVRGYGENGSGTTRWNIRRTGASGNLTAGALMVLIPAL